MTPASYSQLNEALDALQLGVSASELHGSLTGFLCAGGLARAGTWLRDLALEEVEEAIHGEPQAAVFDRLYAGCSAGLEDPSLGFDLLLPDDEAPIGERAHALVDWCRGFLGGIGLANVDVRNGLSGDGTEVLGDFSRIAATRFESVDGEEEDEEAYAEVVEYVRVGVMLLHNELARPPVSETRH
jgi:hypothetical protein